jgi:thioredoxin 2
VLRFAMEQLDEKGVVVNCAQCGQRNRIAFAHLDDTIRCGKCKSEIPPISRPIAIRASEEFEALISSSSVPVLVDFWAAWCGPCKMVAPELEKVAAELRGEIVVVKVDTEALPTLAARFQISSIPSLIVFARGREAARTAGARPAAAIKAFVAQVAAAA